MSEFVVNNGFKETGIGPVPVDWEVVPLKQTANRLKVTINPQSYPNEIFDYYSIPAYQVSDEPNLERGKEIHSQKLTIELGTILFGKLNPRVPKVWQVVSNSTRRKIASTEFIPLLPLADKIYSEFLYYLAWSNYILPRSQELVSGSTPSRQRVDVKAFLDIPIPLPPLPEQHRIAHALTAIQRKMETLDANITALREVKRSLMQRLFTYGPDAELAETKETEIGEVPAYWEVVSWEEIAEIIMGQSPPGDTYNENGNGIPLINGPAEYGDKHPIPVKWTTQPTKLTQIGDILFCVRGNTTGRMNVADQEYCIGRGVAAIRNREKVSDTGYIFYLALLNAAKILNIASAGGSVFPNITKSQLNNFKVPNPPLSDQQKIAYYLTTLDRKIATREQEKAAVQEIFKSALHQLMTGQIRLTDTEANHEETD